MVVTRRLLMVAAIAVLCVAPAAPGRAYAATVPTLPNNAQGCLPPPQASDSEQPWAERQLDPRQVWPVTQGAGVVVGVVDTGVDAATPQLAGRVLTGVDVTTANHGPANTDCYGHGTFVAGIIAAAPGSGTGFAGMAPAATILPVRITNDAQIAPDALAQGITDAVQGGARVVNVSAGSSQPSPALAGAVAYADTKDVVVVAAAGNDGQQGDPTTYPAAYPTVLAVGAIDSGGQHADFSETGPYVSLAAPGVNVISVGPGGPGQWEGDGTSYAAPFVAGVAALVRAYHPRLSAAQVRHRLEVTADHPAAPPDPSVGWGVVNPLAAVTAVLPEEGSAGTTVIHSPPARGAGLRPPDRLGPILAVLGLFLVVALAATGRLVSRLTTRR